MAMFSNLIGALSSPDWGMQKLGQTIGQAPVEMGAIKEQKAKEAAQAEALRKLAVESDPTKAMGMMRGMTTPEQIDQGIRAYSSGRALAQQAQAAREVETAKTAAMDHARQNNDNTSYQALASGAMSGKEYFSSLAAINAAKQKAQYEGKGNFRETINTENGNVSVLFNSSGTPLAVLGSQAGNYTTTQVLNPATNTMENVLINKNDPNDRRVLGAAEKPKIESKPSEVKKGHYDVFVDGQLVNTVDSMSKAERLSDNMGKVAHLGTVRNMIGEMEQLLVKHVNDFVGPVGWGSLAKAIPETDAAYADTLITGITANLGMEQMKALKEAGNGATGLGAISNMELINLQSTLGRLNQANNPEQIAEILDQIDTSLSNLMAVAAGKPEEANINWEDPVYDPVISQRVRNKDGELVGIIGPNNEWAIQLKDF